MMGISSSKGMIRNNARNDNRVAGTAGQTEIGARGAQPLIGSIGAQAPLMGVRRKGCWLFERDGPRFEKSGSRRSTPARIDRLFISARRNGSNVERNVVIIVVDVIVVRFIYI